MFAQFKKFSIAICICTHIRTCLCNSKTIGESQEGRQVGGAGGVDAILGEEKVLSQAAKKPFAYPQGLRVKGIPTKGLLGRKKGM